MAATRFISSARLARSVLPHLRSPKCLITTRWINVAESLSSAQASPRAVDDVKRPRSVPVRAAFHLLQSGHRYLDVRTYDEFKAGHPTGALNIPYMFKSGLVMSKNPKFLEEVSSHFQKDDEIVVGCRSGVRSLQAAIDLQASGFTRVTDVAGGYSEWIDNGLPSAN